MFAFLLAVAVLLSPEWKVEVQTDGAWREVPVRTIPVGAGIGQTPRTNGTAKVTCDGLKWYCSMARAALCEVEWKRDLKVRVRHDGALSVSPGNLGFGPFSGTAEMTFAKPAKLLVKADGDNVHALSLLVTPPVPAPDATGFRHVLRFGSGYHDVSNNPLIRPDAYGAPVVTIRESDTLVWLEKGARVCAAFDVRGGAKHVRIVGPGTVDLLARLPYFESGFREPMPEGGLREGVLPAVYIHERAEDVTVKDLTILADFRGINARNARGIVMDNVNMFTSVVNADGVNVINTEDLLTVNCYIRSQDDAWCAYNNCDSILWLWDPPEYCTTRRCRNLRCYDSMLVTCCRTVVLGGHGTNNVTDRDVMEDIEVAHCTLLEAKGEKKPKRAAYWSGMLRILSQSEELVRDLRFRDLDLEWGRNYVGQPVHLCVREAKNASYTERGGYAIRDILFDDIRFVDAPEPLPLPAYFAAPTAGDEGFGIRNVVFRNVTVNGKDFAAFGRTEKGEVSGVRFE